MFFFFFSFPFSALPSPSASAPFPLVCMWHVLNCAYLPGAFIATGSYIGLGVLLTSRVDSLLKISGGNESGVEYFAFLLIYRRTSLFLIRFSSKYLLC